MPTLDQSIIANFANDIVIVALRDNYTESTKQLQNANTQIQRRIKLKETKFILINLTNKKIVYRSVYIHQQSSLLNTLLNILF